jgi:hypothetical protein
MLGCCAACGGRTSAAFQSLSQIDSGEDGSDGGLAMDSAAGAWTPCTSPDGVELCGGTCGAASGCACLSPASDPGALELCLNSTGYDSTACYNTCGATQVCINFNTDDVVPDYTCEPWSAGIMFASAGQGSRVRYSDFAFWDGSDIPPLASCPVTGGRLAFCDGVCGGCDAGQVCTGRSPIHPVGWCASPPYEGCSTANNRCSSAGTSCLTLLQETFPSGPRHETRGA